MAVLPDGCRVASSALIVLIGASLELAACGGSGSSVPAPTVQITSNASTITPGDTVTLTWSSVNASSCQASGSWSGTMGTSGNQVIDPPNAHNDFRITCTGSGGMTAADTVVTVELPHYVVTTIGLWGATAINDAGGVSGWIGSPQGPCCPFQPNDAAAWTSGSAPPLPPPPAGQDPMDACGTDPVSGGSNCESHANGINSAGEVVVSVGGVWVPLGNFVVHYGPGTATVIPGLQTASAINDSGVIVGQTPAGHAATYASGTALDLGTFGGTQSTAAAVNNSGRVVGSAWTAANAHEHAFLSDGARLLDLGDLGGGDARASAVNSAGVVVGTSSTSGTDWHAFRYMDNDMTDIGSAATNAGSAATGINDAGLIVGWFAPDGPTNPSVHHPAVYSNGTFFDLLPLVTDPANLPQGLGVGVDVGAGEPRINNHGQIAVPMCSGWFAAGHIDNCWVSILSPPSKP